MERTNNKIKIPDAMNCSLTKDFTQVPNTLLRNPDISGKAKAILCLLLSNKEGWHSYITTIEQMMKEGKDAISSALKELEEFKYLQRIRYREIESKKLVGSFWAYTDIPESFNIKEQIAFLKKKNLEIISKKKPQPDFPYVEKPYVEKPYVENPVLKIPTLINPISNEINSDKNPNIFLLGFFEKSWIEDISFQEVIRDFAKLRKIKNKPLTRKACKLIKGKTIGFTKEEIIAAFNTAIEGSWTTIWPEHKESSNKFNSSPSKQQNSGVRHWEDNYVFKPVDDEV